MADAGKVTTETFRGVEVRAHLQDVAQLRMQVFRAFPYLYDGDMAYETAYLEAYARSPDSVFVLAFAGGDVVGAATGIPLADDDATFQVPVRAQGLRVEDVFYFGESVLLPAYRGRGLGHAFFDARETHARRLGRFSWTAFCAVDRAPDDPRRPGDFRPNDVFWHKRGYARQPGMTVCLAWRELGEAQDSEKPLTFWLRALEKS